MDPALLGLGYAPAPGGTFDPASLPDPYDRAFVLQDITEARLERSSGQMGKAVARLKSAASRDPGNPAVWFEYGETLRRAGKFAEAVTALDRALAISPQVYQVWTAKGHALLALSRDDEAARCYEKALALQSDYVPAVNALAAYYLDTGKADKALPLLERAISSGIGDANTYLLRGQLRLSQGRSGDAAVDFDAAVRRSPNPEETLNEEANTYMGLKMTEDGRRLYLEGIRRYPTYAPNHLAMGSYWLKQRKPEEALPYFKAALELKLDPQTRQKVQGLVGQLEGGSGVPGGK